SVRTRPRAGIAAIHQSRESAAWSVLTTRAEYASDQSALESKGGRGRARLESQLAVDVLQVPGDGVLADHELCGDLAVALAFPHEPQDLDLATRQPVLLVRVAGCEAGEVRRGSELVEDLTRGLELERCGLLVGERGARLREQCTRAADLVRRV